MKMKMKMKKVIYFCLMLSIFSIKLNAQSNSYSNSFSISPGSLFLGRLNTKFEKLSESNFTYGARTEVSFLGTLDRHIWVIPYGRFYFFNKEQNGLYAEVGAGYRMRYQKTFSRNDSYDPSDPDFFKSAPVGRVYLGTQWFVGKNSKTPFDLSLGFNIDAQNFNVPEGASVVTGLIGPLSVFSLRLQTGFAW